MLNNDRKNANRFAIAATIWLTLLIITVLILLNI